MKKLTKKQIEENIKWEKRQKILYHKGLLSKDKIAKLETIPDWTWDIDNKGETK